MTTQQILALAKKNSQISQGGRNKTTQPKKYAVGDDINIGYDPFGKHTSRDATVLAVLPDGYRVQFTATTGESLDEGVRKPFQRKDKTKRLVLTSVIHNIKFKDIK